MLAKNKEKKLEKALKLAGIEKEKWDDVISLISDDEDEVEEVKEEEPKVEDEKVETTEEKEEKPKKEVEKPKEKEVEKTEDKELDVDAILEKLGIEQIKTVVSEQAKKIDELQKTIEKTSVVGAQVRGNTVDDEDDEYNFENLFNKISTNKVQYNKK